MAVNWGPLFLKAEDDAKLRLRLHDFRVITGDEYRPLGKKIVTLDSLTVTFLVNTPTASMRTIWRTYPRGGDSSLRNPAEV